MNFTDKNSIASYTNLFENLSSDIKIELIEGLTKSLKKGKTKLKGNFFKSFGAFKSSKSAKEICKEIRASRKFPKREISF
jgi:hypothetical protein